jgi:hypothetical protein
MRLGYWNVYIYRTVPMDICSFLPRYQRGCVEDLVRKSTEQDTNKKTQPTGPPIDQLWETHDEYIWFVSQPPSFRVAVPLTL